MIAHINRIFVVTLLAALAACGRGGRDNTPPATPAPTPAAPQRGTLIQNPPPRTMSLSASDLSVILGLGATGQRIMQLVSAPKCGIDIHQLRYNTVDPAGQSTTASGAMMIPTGSDAACQGPRPIVVYAHGTIVEREFDIANIRDDNNVEGLLIAATFTAQGYIVVAPNYAGIGTTTLPYHPYLNADQQSKDTADALTAARSALPTSFAPSATDSGKLFLTGYSQGGYVALATHRLLQQNGAAVTASAPMSGPYALAAFGDAVFYGQVVASAPLFFAYAATGYQRAYGNVYANLTDLFEARYATGIDSLLPTLQTRGALFSQGRLPRDQLFDSTPPDPAFAPYTPATAPRDLAPVFAKGFGADRLITNAYRLAYLRDAQANPDGAFPNTTDGRPAVNPQNGLRLALKRNDLRDWAPTAPVLLCAGHDDPTVLYMNTELMQGFWSASGAPVSAKVLDVDGNTSLNDPDATLKVGFDAAKQLVAAAAIAGGATDNGAAAVADVYHSTLVPPFCLAAAKTFFSGR
jgi:predicted esterase